MRIGSDIGGTFTDFVLFDETSGGFRTYKILSTPENPAQAVLDGLENLGLLASARQSSARLPVVHGSTVATNALLERKGSRTALVTTKGFRDVLAIGRQTRSRLYDFFADRPEPLVPDPLRLEVDERVDHSGQVLRPLNDQDLPALVEHLRRLQVESVAVCLLFSFAHADHERRIASALRQAGFSVSPSHEILPEFREYERSSTTVINAYVSPVLERYIGQLASQLQGVDLRIMQSNGGSISAQQARQEAVRSILSGPAGGVVGALQVAQAAGFNQAITFDMGGTSTDVSLCDGQVHVTSEAEIGGLPIRIPVIDIHTVGAGGGSIAHMDPGGALRVGPHSAGADPGPVCYGRGGQRPTVTDANLILGRLIPELFLDGRLPLDEHAARQSLAQAVPDRLPAASQGTMNNLTIGGWDARHQQPYAYYETIGGGMGARPGKDGADAIHTHMTNTMNTPVEALEYVYPLRVQRYEILRQTGGSGRWRGGNGIRRDLQILGEAQLTVLTERRIFAPYGLSGGKPGKLGRNVLIREEDQQELPGKITLTAKPGDVISIRTPGGGGYGTPDKGDDPSE